MPTDLHPTRLCAGCSPTPPPPPHGHSVTTAGSQPHTCQDTCGCGNHSNTRSTGCQKMTIEKMRQISKMWAGLGGQSTCLAPGALGSTPSRAETRAAQGRPRLNGEFKSSLGHMRPCLKREPYGQMSPWRADVSVRMDSPLGARDPGFTPAGFCTH